MNAPVFVAVIPAYNPGPVVVSVVYEASKNVDYIILIDDGSDDKNKRYLRECEKFKNIRSIVFPCNKGKGYALKKGIEEALSLNPDYILTMDSDGQHNPAEISKFKMILSGADPSFDLVIGTRKKKSDMPFRSNFGNVFISKLVGMIFDKWIEDTQSGFRTLSSDFAKEVISRIPPGKYETEMKMLIDAIENNRRVAALEIETIYFEKNIGSQFRTVKDSLLVIASFVKFTLAGLVSFLIDYGSFIVLSYLLGINYMPAHLASRTFSGICGSFLNKRRFIKHVSRSHAEKMRHVLAVLFSFGTTSLLLYLLVEFVHFHPLIAKPLAECMMVIIKFLFMGKLIFKPEPL